MELKSILNRLKKSKDFRMWEKNNVNTFFSYAFKIIFLPHPKVFALF